MALSRMDGINAKIERADQHLRDLGTQIDGFLKTHLNTVVGEYDAEQRLQTFKVRPIPSTPLGFCIGEIVVHLRSALDHLVYQLVMANGRTPTRDNLFPINRLREEYEGSAVRKIQGVSETAATLIRGLQPYTRGHAYSGHPFFVLNKLANTDKHRVLGVMVSSIRFHSVQLAALPGDKITMVERPRNFGVRISPERETEALIIELPPGSSAMDMKAKVTINVVFDEPPIEGYPVVPSLYQLMQFTRQSIGLFATELER